LPIWLLGPAAAQGPARPPAPQRPTAAAPARPAAVPVRGEGAIADIKVEGNQRIETGTILSYMLVRVGDPFDPDRLDRSLKTLYATGLFQDVRLSRDGDTLVVHLVENPLVNRVVFEGNHELTDENLRSIVQLKSRAVFTPSVAATPTWVVADVSWAAATFTNGTGVIGTLAQTYVDVATCAANVATCGTVNMIFTLAANPAVTRSGAHTMVMTWKFESIG
jgi:hypothetical protein